MSFLAADAFELLRRAHEQGRLAHAYLITGPEGSGKRQLVTDLARLILGTDGNPFTHPDARVLEPESKSRRIRIELIRELESGLQMRSVRGGKKVGVIFDADRLVEQAANAFLKTLEEPPAQSHLFLVSSLPDQLLETILSRCIEVPLKSAERRGPSELQTALLTALADFSKQPGADLPHVFLLVRRFQELLASAKEAISGENDDAFKKEETLYKQVGAKDALDDREEYFKALTESRYIAERSRLLATLEEWWADVLRQSIGDAAPQLDHPDFAAETRTLAERFNHAQLLRKSAALETLRENLSRNVQEQLAIEVGFLHAFGAGAAP